MSGRHQRLADLRHQLEETGLPYSIEAGKKHIIVSLNGKRIAVLPHGKRLAAERRWGTRFTFIEQAIRKATAP